MVASLFDSPMFVKSFPTGEASRLFSDSAAVRAVLLVEGTLAKVQGELGLIPEDSAFFIHRSAMEVQVDPAGLSNDLAKEGFVPAVVAAFAKAMEAPEHSKFIQHEVKADEIETAALALRLRQFLTHCDKQVAQLDQDAVDVAAINAALSDARRASVGLCMSTSLNVAKSLADTLRLPLKEQPIELATIAQAANTICAEIAKSDANKTRLSQLETMCSGMTEMLASHPHHMQSFCLPQACLCAAASLEIANA